MAGCMLKMKLDWCSGIRITSCEEYDWLCVCFNL